MSAEDDHPSPELTDEELAAAIVEPATGSEMKLYWDVVPPPSQAALLTLSCLPSLRRRLRFVRVNVMRSQQFLPAFRAVNPLHQVPMLQEADGSVITESRAIMVYLAELAAADSSTGNGDSPASDSPTADASPSLYPLTPRGRADCHRWMLFDVTCLYPRLKDYHLPVMSGLAGRPDTTALPAIHEALGVLDTELQRRPYVCGDAPSLADLGLVVTVSQARAVGVPLDEHAAITDWYERLRDRLPGLRQAERGSEEYANTLQQIMDAWDRRQVERGGGE